jgi:hypothetical protein
MTHRSIALHILYYNLKKVPNTLFFDFPPPSQISSVTIMVLMDQQKWSLLVASFVLLIKALQELFFILQSSFSNVIL